MTTKIRPSRRGNFEKTGARLAELGIKFLGYDHHQGTYVLDGPTAEQVAAAAADPLIDVETDSTPKPRRTGPVWASRDRPVDLTVMGARLRRLRIDAGLDLATAASLTAGAVTAEAIDRIEQTGDCDLRSLIALVDVYAASIDQIVGRSVISGSRRR